MKKRKRFNPPRDASGRFKKKFVPQRDKSGRFKSPKRGPRKKKRAERAEPVGRKQHAPAFNLCFAADREDFYQQILEDRRKASKNLSEEDISAMRVRIEIEGTPRKKRGHKRRKTTAFIGRRTFSNLHALRRFLLMDTGHVSGVTNDNPHGLDWRKKALCQFKKHASIIVKKERGKVRTIKRYKLES